MSVPNQRTVIIHSSKEKYFIKIGKEEWKKMFCELQDNPCAVALFMYLAGNQEGYCLELSPAAFENASGMSRSSFYRGRDILLERGYLYRDSAERLCFRTNLNTEIKPHFGEPSSMQKKQKSFKTEMAQSQERNKTVSQVNREINNKQVIDIKDKTVSSVNKFAYLDKLIDFDDGSYKVDGETRFLDGNEDFQFWSRSKDEIFEGIKTNTSFNDDEITYIIGKMLGD